MGTLIYLEDPWLLVKHVCFGQARSTRTQQQSLVQCPSHTLHCQEMTMECIMYFSQNQRIQQTWSMIWRSWLIQRRQRQEQWLTDLDGDGYTEIVSAGYTAGEVYVYTFAP